MGGSASCSIANISVYEEWRDMLKNINEIVFNKRFLDDLFWIVKSTEIQNMENWLKNIFKHKYLQFTSILIVILWTFWI